MRLDDLIRVARTEVAPRTCMDCGALTDATLTAEIDRSGDFEYFTLSVRCAADCGWYYSQEFSWRTFDNGDDEPRPLSVN